MPKERHTLMKPSKVDIDEYKCGLRVRKWCIILRFHRIAGLISVGSSSEALTEPLNPWTDKPHSPYATPTKKTPTPLQSELCKCHYCKKVKLNGCSPFSQSLRVLNEAINDSWALCRARPLQLFCAERFTVAVPFQRDGRGFVRGTE